MRFCNTLLSIIILVVIAGDVSAQQLIIIKNSLRMDSLKIDLGTIQWKKEDGYEYIFRIKNYGSDTILYPPRIVIYHDSWINPQWALPKEPLAPRKSAVIKVLAFPDRPPYGGSIQKAGAFYIFIKSKNGKLITEQYPVVFRCTVVPKLPDTTHQTPASLIEVEK